MIGDPRIFFFVAWFLMGPINPRLVHDLPLALPLTIILFVVAFAVIGRQSYRGKSFALLGVLALMFYQSLDLIVTGLHAELMRPDPVAVGIRYLFSFFFDLNLGLAIAGLLAAFGVAVFMEFGKL